MNDNNAELAWARARALEQVGLTEADVAEVDRAVAHSKSIGVNFLGTTEDGLARYQGNFGF